MGRTVKKYEELTIIDDFMFGKVMRIQFILWKCRLGIRENCR